MESAIGGMFYLVITRNTARLKDGQMPLVVVAAPSIRRHARSLLPHWHLAKRSVDRNTAVQRRAAFPAGRQYPVLQPAPARRAVWAPAAAPATKHCRGSRGKGFVGDVQLLERHQP